MLRVRAPAWLRCPPQPWLAGAFLRTGQRQLTRLLEHLRSGVSPRPHGDRPTQWQAAPAGRTRRDRDIT
jgi:hypothetical protein